MSRTSVPNGPPVRATLVARIEARLAPLDAELEALPISRALRDGTVTKEAYAGLLQSLLTLHRSFERSLLETRHIATAGATAGAVPGFAGPQFRREEALMRDLRILGGRLPVRSREPLDRFESLMRAWSRPPCVALVGALYELERARRRSLALVKPLARALAVRVAPRSGLDYLLDGSERAVRRLQDVQTWIDAHVRDEPRAKELIDGAIETATTRVAISREASG